MQFTEIYLYLTEGLLIMARSMQRNLGGIFDPIKCMYIYSESASTEETNKDLSSSFSSQN